MSDNPESAGAITDTCSRCGQNVPITSKAQMEKLKEARDEAFKKMREEKEG